jgi:radical SAM superfamily enzyme YgiQ (UPF0313 family)
MKILLITLPKEGEFVNWTTSKKFLKDPKVVKYIPLGLVSLASNLPKNHEVKILDPPSYNWTIHETIKNIEKEDPDVLGISAITRRTYALKQILEKIKVPYITVGGPHATDYSDLILEWGADSVFIGQLVDKEFSKIGEKPKGKIYGNTQINEIKFPDRKLINYKDYFFKGKVLFESEKRMPMFSSVGCPNRCIFCNVQSKKIQYKEPKKVVDEMEYLYSLGSRSIHVLDDNFNINRNHLNAIIDEKLKRIDVEWSGRGQVNMDLNLVPKLAASNFKRIHVGIEALDNNILKYLNKPHRIKQIERFCKVMNDNNIEVLGYFILGSPIETKKYRKKLPQRLKKLGIKYPWFNVLFPEPDTQYYKSLLNSVYKIDYWAEFMKNPTPHFEIPYPYGEKTKQRIMEEIDEINMHMSK